MTDSAQHSARILSSARPRTRSRQMRERIYKDSSTKDKCTAMILSKSCCTANTPRRSSLLEQTPERSRRASCQPCQTTTSPTRQPFSKMEPSSDATPNTADMSTRRGNEAFWSIISGGLLLTAAIIIWLKWDEEVKGPWYPRGVLILVAIGFVIVYT